MASRSLVNENAAWKLKKKKSNNVSLFFKFSPYFMNLAENSLESNAQVLFFKKLKIFKLRHASSLVEPKKNFYILE